MVAESAWGCADPGRAVRHARSTTGTPARTPDRINASNPCSEYMFLDDTACNLSSLNLTKFLDDDGNFDVDGFRHAIRIFFMAQEILVDFSSYPTAAIAQNCHDYRPLGLGYANLGTLLMLLGIPYDSDEGRAIAARSPRSCAATPTRAAPRSRRKGAVPRLRQEPRADAARDAHAPRRGLRDRPRRAAPSDAAGAPPCEDWDDAVAARRAARLPQRAGHRARADRHHRPADGLRHHRHRARLRAGEVQEARRRRLLQDRQPVGAGRRSSASATARLQIREIVAYVSRHEHAARRAARQPRQSLKARASTTPSSRKVEKALPGVFDLALAFGAVGRSATTPTSASASPTAEYEQARLQPAQAPRLHREARSTRPTT